MEFGREGSIDSWDCVWCCFNWIFSLVPQGQKAEWPQQVYMNNKEIKSEGSFHEMVPHGCQIFMGSVCLVYVGIGNSAAWDAGGCHGILMDVVEKICNGKTTRMAKHGA